MSVVCCNSFVCFDFTLPLSPSYITPRVRLRAGPRCLAFSLLFVSYLLRQSVDTLTSRIVFFIPPFTQWVRCFRVPNVVHLLNKLPLQLLSSHLQAPPRSMQQAPDPKYLHHWLRAAHHDQCRHETFLTRRRSPRHGRSAHSPLSPTPFAQYRVRATLCQWARSQSR